MTAATKIAAIAITAAIVDPTFPAASASRSSRRPQKAGDGGTPLSSAQATRRGQSRPAASDRSRIGRQGEVGHQDDQRAGDSGRDRRAPDGGDAERDVRHEDAPVAHRSRPADRPDPSPDGAAQTHDQQDVLEDGAPIAEDSAGDPLGDDQHDRHQQDQPWSYVDRSQSAR